MLMSPDPISGKPLSLAQACARLRFRHLQFLDILGQTRILTTAITLETSRGDFAQAMALGLVLLALALAVNAAFAWRRQVP